MRSELCRAAPELGPVHVPIARGAKNFETVRLNEAIYATGWDGSIVVTAKSDGTYRVLTER